MPEPTDIAAVRKLCERIVFTDDEALERAAAMYPFFSAMSDEIEARRKQLDELETKWTDEIERLRGLLKRCEPVLDAAQHGSYLDEDCDLLEEVRRVNKETPDAT